MKQLSEFTDERGVQVAADVLCALTNIRKNEKNKKYFESGKDLTVAEMLSEAMKNTPEEMMKIFAVLSEKDPAEYHCTASEAMINTMLLAADNSFLLLFISQSREAKAATSSGSVSESAN